MLEKPASDHSTVQSRTRGAVYARSMNLIPRYQKNWVSRRDRSEKQLTHYERLTHYVRYPTWSPTGNSMVYEYGEITGNIWTLEAK